LSRRRHSKLTVLFCRRPNGVDDLLKLAKQFDFNMFRQDEEEVEELHQQSLELLSEDILDISSCGDSHPALKATAAAAAAGSDVKLHQDQYLEDDLDFLFDGPTQHVSGSLSQVSTAQPSRVKPASKDAPGKPCAPSHGCTSGVSTPKDEFEDDWENDDLLNDSLVLEMTQNPQNFIAPKHCSTQKPPSQVKYQHPANVRSGVSKVEKDNVRRTFKLESNPNLSVKGIQTDTWTKPKDYGSKSAEKDTQQIKFSSRTGVLVQVGHQQNKTVTSEPQKHQFHQNNSVAKHNTTTSNSSAQSFPTVVSSHRETPAVSDLLDEDLSSFFLSDPVWDDPADDDLLCEMCDDLENQIQSAVNVPAKQTNQRAALQPSNGHQQQTANQEAFLPKKHTQTPCAPGRPAGGLISSVPAGVRGTDSFTYAQVKNTSGSTNSWTCAQGSSRVQTSPQTKPHKGQFTFKKPNNPVSTATAKVVGKCSAAEIELKKQQAMERRRQRLQAAQNLRAPT
ncbi:uncharacterized protein LOC121965292, partial [Plectropomus leopardus]|uniref:uncharacterized protein LOC121965292 n=1 Tax=Plectropomus leopardus TaxID=160734 RepID=UPI001C4B630C